MILSLGLALFFLNLMSRYVLTALDQQRAYLGAILMGLVVNITLGAVMIHSFGFVGACVGVLGGEVTVLIVCQRRLRRYSPPGDLLREMVRPLLAALGMGIVVFLLRDANLLLPIALGAIVYVVLLLSLRAFSSEDLGVMRSVYVSFRLPGSGWLTRAASRS